MVSKNKSNGLLHDESNVICFLCCNLLRCSRHLSNSKTTHLWTVEVFSSNYSCDQYTHIDNITLKVFFPNIHQRSKAHFLVITHRGANAILEVNLNKQ